MLEFASSDQRRGTKTVRTLQASEDGTLVGRVKIELDATNAYLEDVWVERAFRGSGKGDQLLDEAMKQAREWGCTLMTCDAIAYEPLSNGRPGPPSPGAQARLEAWYRRRGFVRVPGEDTMFEMELSSEGGRRGPQ